VVVQVANHIDLLLNNLGEDSIFDCEQASDPISAFFLYFGLDAHPERHACDDFKHDAAQTPDIDGPGIFILFHLLEHLFIIFQFVLEQNVVEDLRRHVFGCGHGELLEVGEEETAAEVDQLDSSDVVHSLSQFFFSAGLEQNVLSLEVGVDDVVAVYQKEGFDYFNHQNF
jgi:hypothetical protein